MPHSIPLTINLRTSGSTHMSFRRGRRRDSDFDAVEDDDENQSREAPRQGFDIDRVFTFTNTGVYESAPAPRPPPTKRRKTTRRRPVDEAWAAWLEAGGENSAHGWATAFGTGDPDLEEWEGRVDDISPFLGVDEAGDDRDEFPSGRKSYKSSDDPMGNWVPHAQEFLDETMMLNDPGEHPECCTCFTPWAARPPPLPPSSPTNNEHTRDAPAQPSSVDTLILCETCGMFWECVDCSLKRHARAPLHNIRVWRNDGKASRSSLKALGQVHQLGHQGGRCAVPKTTARPVTVLHTNGVHSVSVTWCDCDKSDHALPWQQALRDGWYPASLAQPQTFASIEVLALFRLLNVLANVNVRDFVTVLERKSNPHGEEWLPERYKSLGLMTRQWSYLSRMRRAGLGQMKDGLAKAGLGSAAVHCLACPREGVNLPDAWRDAKPEDAFLFMLYLALDANFRLRNRLRKKSANKSYDILGDGMGYQVPQEDYLEHLRNYLSEEDISTCIAFAALFQKDTRLSTGLRSTGVGGCICARHELVRPLGIGDLMKGERYANMDFIFWSAIMGVCLLYVLISYDVGCQWKIHLEERFESLPDILKKPCGCPQTHGSPKIRVGLPVWHGGVHDEYCATCNSLRYKTGAGMTDGEGVERVWSLLNPAAGAMKEMHADGRHAALEDLIDNHNYTKNLSLGALLDRRLLIAKEEKDAQIDNFKEVSAGVSSQQKAEWMAMIEAWHREEELPAKARKEMNPYAATWTKNDMTVAEAQRDLQADEATEAQADVEDEELLDGVRNRGSGTTFLKIGVRLQALQRQIRCALRSKSTLTLGRDEKVQRWRTSFFKQLGRFRHLQASFLPPAAGLLRSEAESRGPDAIALSAENVRLWMPWEVPPELRPQEGRGRAIYEMEARLREAQCSESLTKLRQRLHAKRHWIQFRNANVTGQGRTTRARSLIDSTTDRVNAEALRYQDVYAALASLVGAAQCGPFRRLDREDITMKFVVDHDGRAARRLAKIAGRLGRNAPVVVPEQDVPTADLEADVEDATDELQEDEPAVLGAEVRGGSKRKLSWIWTAQGAPDQESEKYMHESVRVEWCKAHARKKRWSEEVALLTEEQRRVLASLIWSADRWQEWADLEEEGVVPALRRGRRAYALRQKAWVTALGARFARRWTGKRDRDESP